MSEQKLNKPQREGRKMSGNATGSIKGGMRMRPPVKNRQIGGGPGSAKKAK